MYVGVPPRDLLDYKVSDRLLEARRRLELHENYASSHQCLTPPQSVRERMRLGHDLPHGPEEACKPSGAAEHGGVRDEGD